MESDEPNREISDNRVFVKKSSFNGRVIGTIVVVAIAAFFAGSYTSNLNSEQITQKDLDEAMAKLELKILQNKLPTEQAKQPVQISADDDPVRGNEEALVTIIEFSDFQCPFCARFHLQTLPLLMENYIDTGKAKLVYRDFPIQSIHPNAMPAAVAAECADDQGKFWEYHDKLFENQNQWGGLDTADVISVFGQYASDLELDQQEFNTCLSGGKHINEIRNDLDDGREYGVSGTPGFFIGNEKLGYVELKGAQPFENFKKVLDSQLMS